MNSILNTDLGKRHYIGISVFIILGILPIIGIYPIAWDILFVSQIIAVLYLMMFAISWDFVSGYTGQISFGHTFFFAIGGYTTAILNINHGVHPIIGISIAIVLAIIGGIIIGVPALRLSGPYLALVTLIAPLFLMQVFVLFSDIFKGHDGFAQSPDAFVGTGQHAIITVNEFEHVIVIDYYIAYILLLLIIICSLFITRSDAGTIFIAIRENEDFVRSIGINVEKFKIFSFLGSSAIGGIAGAAFVHSTVGHPQPSAVLDVSISIDVILVTVIGGMGTIIGPIIGVIFIEMITQFLEYISQYPQSTLPIIGRTPDDLMPIPIYLLTIMVVYYMPSGLVRKGIGFGENIEELVEKEDDYISVLSALYDKFIENIK